MLPEKLVQQFNDLGFEIHYFKLSWYNDAVASEYFLPYPDDALAFVVLSNPSWFEKSFLPFLANNLDPSMMDKNDDLPENHSCLAMNCRDPIDQCMRHHFDILAKEISSTLNTEVDKIHDFELLMPYRRPRVLLQTAAHVSGAAYYYRLPRRDKNVHKLGLCIHPEYGGWFGLRGVFVFKQILVPNLERKPPANVIPDIMQQEALLKLFNERWRDGSYRDFIQVKSRYSDLQFKYFSLEPRQRFEFIRKEIYPKLNELISSPSSSNELKNCEKSNGHH
ncbi:cyanocobalamin reductase / alkylcobalamin dealkylase [Dermatophagoides farinae]|uniref:cyanocobalamin reductase / alkylcobalamin dealkylase n=1 Tax=Dermatophagoides farinae TaxID=6954 RepID=UPI003F617F1A